MKERFESLVDVAILAHGFTTYLRDYDFFFEANWGVAENGGRAGVYRGRFTHVPYANFETTVTDLSWVTSWDDRFISYDDWISSGSPDGYVWGVNYSIAYPGFNYVENSDNARGWTQRFGRDMHEVNIETNAFRARLIFHDFRLDKVSDGVEIVNKVLIPIQNQ